MSNSDRLTHKGPGRSNKLVKALAQQIDDDWVKGRKAGTTIPIEGKLAADYNVNRRTIRSALTILAKNHRVVRPPYRRAQVAAKEAAAWDHYIGKSIGLCCFTQVPFMDPFFQRILSSIVIQLEPTGMRVSIPTRNWRWGMKGRHTPANHFADEDVKGLVLFGRPLPRVLASWTSLDIPMLAVDFDATLEGLDSFCFANYEAGQQLANRLLKLGHRRIAVVAEDPKRPSGKMDEAWKQRHAGFRDGLKEGGVARIDAILTSKRGEFASVSRALNILLARPIATRPTALYMPWNFLSELKSITKSHRIRIPKDLTVVGVVDEESETELSSMRFGAHRMAGEAIIRLLRKIRDPKWAQRKAKLCKSKGQFVSGRTHSRAPLQGK